MAHFMSDGVTPCAKGDGHVGGHWSESTRRRNAELQRERDLRKSAGAREAEAKRRRERYRNDPEYRAERLAYARRWREQNPNYMREWWARRKALPQ